MEGQGLEGQGLVLRFATTRTKFKRARNVLLLTFESLFSFFRVGVDIIIVQ